MSASGISKRGRRPLPGKNTTGLSPRYDPPALQPPDRVARQKRDGAIRAVAFSLDGRTAASGGIDRVVRVWQVATGEELLSFPNQSNIINSLAFAPDGGALAAAVHDGTLRIWRAPRTEQ